MLLHLASNSPYDYRIALWRKMTPLICQLGDLIKVVTGVYVKKVEESHELKILQLYHYTSNDHRKIIAMASPQISKTTRPFHPSAITTVAVLWIAIEFLLFKE